MWGQDMRGATRAARIASRIRSEALEC
jgi:hypothetical protein